MTLKQFYTFNDICVAYAAMKCARQQNSRFISHHSNRTEPTFMSLDWGRKVEKMCKMCKV